VGLPAPWRRAASRGIPLTLRQPVELNRDLPMALALALALEGYLVPG
jgi:hypothetical protein